RPLACQIVSGKRNGEAGADPARSGDLGIYQSTRGGGDFRSTGGHGAFRQDKPMRVKKFLYFADFVFYPLASAALVALALLLKEPLRWDEAAIGFACGLALWSLAEYVIHRFALHGPAYLAALHDMHHSDPR